MVQSIKRIAQGSGHRAQSTEHRAQSTGHGVARRRDCKTARPQDCKTRSSEHRAQGTGLLDERTARLQDRRTARLLKVQILPQLLISGSAYRQLVARLKNCYILVFSVRFDSLNFLNPYYI